jgi:hypothetical protein
MLRDMFTEPLPSNGHMRYNILFTDAVSSSASNGTLND